MKRMTRAYVAMILAGILVLTGQSMAVMRGMPGAAGEVVLCTGTGPIAIQVDSEGKPVGPPHICPDCAMSLFLMADAPMALPRRAEPTGRRLAVVRARVAAGAGHLPAMARGPPVRT